MAGYQCPQCKKLAGVGGSNLELTDVEVNGDMVTAKVEVTLNTGCCGEDFLTITLDYEGAVECCENPELVITGESAEEYQGEIPVGKKKKVLGYGATVQLTVHCNACGTDTELDEDIQEPLSSYDYLG